MRDTIMEIDTEEHPHPWYGPCDALGPDGVCAECNNVRLRSAPVARLAKAARLADKYRLFGTGSMWANQRRQLHEALAEYDAAQADDGWRPIETAPEFEPILVFAPKINRGRDSCEVVIRIGDSWWTNGGPNAGDDLDFEEGCEPTHWMPLPPVPVAKEGKIDG